MYIKHPRILDCWESKSARILQKGVCFPDLGVSWYLDQIRFFVITKSEQTYHFELSALSIERKEGLKFSCTGFEGMPEVDGSMSAVSLVSLDL